MAMSDLQRYPWNFNLIKIMEDIVVFFTLEKCLFLIFDNFFIISNEQ